MDSQKGRTNVGDTRMKELISRQFILVLDIDSGLIRKRYQSRQLHRSIRRTGRSVISA